MKYYALEPEVAGHIFGPKTIVKDLDTRPPELAHLDYHFDGWLARRPAGISRDLHHLRASG